jgi:3-deoxy-D-manno-octulosonate 8-phosphate phosphatase (KDO 8-P phosphatase)
MNAPPEPPTTPTAVRMLVLDVDGVLTDGSINLDDQGREFKRFDVRDGWAIRVWMSLGHEVALLTGRGGGAVRARAKELGITRVVEGSRDKGKDLEKLAADAGVPLGEVAHMGDDLPDLPALRRAGYAMTVADAAPEVLEVCNFVTERPGGHAAVREAIKHLLEARGEYAAIIARYH